MTSMLLRIEDIVSGMQRKGPAKQTRAKPAGGEEDEYARDALYSSRLRPAQQGGGGQLVRA